LKIIDKMKIYLSAKQSLDNSYKSISNIAAFEAMVLDGEATKIIVQNFISGFSFNEIEALLNKVIKKLRLNGELLIIEPDLDLICMKFFRNDIDIKEFNELLFSNNRNIKSILTMEYVAAIISKSLKITEKHFDENTSSSLIKARRF